MNHVKSTKNEAIMKKYLLLFLSITVGFHSLAQQDSVANGSFESWTFNPAFDQVDNWFTLNALGQAVGGSLAFQTTLQDEVYAGSHSIKLVTTNLFVGVTPSILTNGVVNTATQDIEGGVEINSRPLALDFAYRYDPNGNDSAIASITLTKWDSQNGTQIVGFAEANLGTTNSLWESEQLLINYSSQETPDTALIFFATSDDLAPNEGTALYLDEVTYAYSLASIIDVEQINFEVFPNPAQNEVRVAVDDSFKPAIVNIYTVDGKRLMTDNYTNKIQIESLQPGVYFVEIENENGQTVTKRFIKE